MMRTSVDEGAVRRILQKFRLQEIDDSRTVVVHDGEVIWSTNHMPNLPLIILGLWRDSEDKTED